MDKQQQWQQDDMPYLLAVEDPQHPGTDIGSGSYNIQEVCSLILQMCLSSDEARNPMSDILF